ncbi:hypothetical protein L6164_020819 [Bauhinia variegata]|uniref:Uncharacterized protein n=1 Tax=Bauhinia variegata TaxID=167791 RepID=A0ACB9MWA1_BAUVA|nr:hypothetical protein L6164_020819 [Bauhinia variegata]
MGRLSTRRAVSLGRVVSSALQFDRPFLTQLLSLISIFSLRDQAMSDTNAEDVKKQEFADDVPKNQVGCDNPADDLKASDKNDENPMPSREQEEEALKKKYGGLLPKKTPLISKDHERAYFDSADWALGKQGEQKPKGPLEALRPKLQPTPHQQVRPRRSAYAPADEGEVEGGNNDASSEDQSGTVEVGNDNNNSTQDQSCQKAQN